MSIPPGGAVKSACGKVRIGVIDAANRRSVANPDAAGQLIETFVIGELRRQLGWSEETPRLHHYRDRAGAEVDLILETPDGRIAAIEVKSGATVRTGDTRWLTNMRDKLGKRFVGGLVLHTGPQALPLGDRLAAVPIDTLWAAG